MRKVISFFLVLIFTCSSTLLFAQKTKVDRLRVDSDTLVAAKQKVTNVKSVANEVRFAVADAFTQGQGVWVHWQMEIEQNNLGFYVYRVDKTGERVVSEFEMGSAFKTGAQPLYEEHYTFYDRTGNSDSVYFVESLGSKGRSQRSSMIVPEVVKSLPNIDGSAMFDKAPVINESGKPSATELSLPSDLKSEVITNSVNADPNRHKEIVALPGAKIATKNSGIIRVTKAQLQGAGFDVNSDPGLWQLYLEGVERPIIVGPNADYIEFFGKTLDTVESDIRTYYLIVGSGAGKRIRTTTPRPSMTNVVSQKYSQTTTKKERISYLNQVLNGDTENYWGRVVASVATNFTFNLSGIDQTVGGDRVLKVAFLGFSLTPHSVEISLNGNVLVPATSTLRAPFSKQYSIPGSFLVEGTNTLQMKSSGAAGDLSFFDNLTIDFPRAYKAENNRLDFYTDNYRKARLSGFSTANVRVFDVTNEIDPINVTGLQSVETNGSFGPVIPAARGRVFYATEASNFATPFSVLPNNPEMLGVPTQGAQFLVISHSSLLTKAQAWAAYRAGQGFSTKVVDVEDVFDEFNYGVSSSQAIEDFLNYAENNWQTPPQYVLLVGDASTNPKNYPNSSGLQFGYWNMVPTRQVNTLFLETGSDEALADFNDDGLAEIPIGRIAARTEADVDIILNKTMLWENSLTPTSLDRGALFTYDLPEGYDFQAMSNRLMSNFPAEMPKTTFQVASLNNGTPTAEQITTQTALINAMNTGKYIVNYTGHGTSGAWRNGNFFFKGNVPSLTNSSAPSLFVSLTCLNAYFIVPREDPDPNFDSTSLAEKLLRASNGGAAAVWASTGETTPDVQEIMGQRFFAQITAGNITRLGDLINDSKTQIAGGTDVRLSWALLGDPMLKMR